MGERYRLIIGGFDDQLHWRAMIGLWVFVKVEWSSLLEQVEGSAANMRSNSLVKGPRLW